MKTPFFARFLEGQINVKSGVQAGPGNGNNDNHSNANAANDLPFVTLKYPSDDDENGTF